MSQHTIDQILEERRRAEKPPPEPVVQEDKFFSIMVGEGLQELFLELQFRDGLRLCLSYGDLIWFHFLPDENCIDMEFGGFLVSIKGRGLAPKLFNGLKQKRVGWIKEADSELQDHPSNTTFIEEITMIPPKGFGAEDDTTS